MRIWDIAPLKLCRNHLLGEHRELHAIWVVLTEEKSGYSRHPETLRWKGKLKALFLRHDSLVREMLRRGYRHYSPLCHASPKGVGVQRVYINSIDEQIKILRNKKCGCHV